MAADETTKVENLDSVDPAEPAKLEPEAAPPEPVVSADPAVDRPREAVYDANITAERGADIGSGTVLSPISETFLQTDHVIPHYEEDSDRYSTLGQSPAAPLPLAGAGGQAVKPEDAFRRAGQ